MKPTIDIKKLAQLASLSPDASRQEMLLRDLEEMIAFADVLASYPLADEATEGERGESVLREDEPRCGLCREELLGAAAVCEAGYIAVPRVIGGGES